MAWFKQNYFSMAEMEMPEYWVRTGVIFGQNILSFHALRLSR